MLIINTITNTVDTTTITLPALSGPWWGCALALTGFIYCAPYTQGTAPILIIDPSTNTVDYSTFMSITTSAIANSTSYKGVVLTPNGMLYFIPRNLGSNQNSVTVVNPVLIVDPTTNTWNETAISVIGSYSGAVLAPNGQIFIIPHTSHNIAVVNPLNYSVTYVPITYVTTNEYSGGVLAQNGLIYSPPYRQTAGMIINPASLAVDQTTITNYPSSSVTFKFNGAVVAPNGKVYFVPYGVNYVMIVRTGIPTIPSWMLDPAFDKY